MSKKKPDHGEDIHSLYGNSPHTRVVPESEYTDADRRLVDAVNESPHMEGMGMIEIDFSKVLHPPQVDQPSGPGVRVVTPEEAEELRRIPGERF